MIATTLGQLVSAEPALAELAKQRLPAKVAYQIARLSRKAGEETKHFHDSRDAAIKELGEEKDGQVVVKPSNIGAFVLRLNELASIEVELDAQPVAIEALGDISAADLLALGPLVAEPCS